MIASTILNPRVRALGEQIPNHIRAALSLRHIRNRRPLMIRQLAIRVYPIDIQPFLLDQKPQNCHPLSLSAASQVAELFAASCNVLRPMRTSFARRSLKLDAVPNTATHSVSGGYLNPSSSSALSETWACARGTILPSLRPRPPGPTVFAPCPPLCPGSPTRRKQQRQ